MGSWIYRCIMRCVVQNEVGIFFPHLITDLCRLARVPMAPNEQVNCPTKSLKGNPLYEKIHELQQELHNERTWKLKNKERPSHLSLRDSKIEKMLQHLVTKRDLPNGVILKDSKEWPKQALRRGT
ncbi:hypothetical protein Gorai_013361, partial [Gossypium raimondii]|nr:hypothetical protein [Gossypium raimondii]